VTFQSTLVLGGARSGKSEYGEKLAENSGKIKVYLATGEARDEEMTDRIALHKDRRGSGWQTIEEPLDVSGVLAQIKPGSIVLLDCVTLWVSNMMAAGMDVEAEVGKLCEQLGKIECDIVIISNEVGLGIVPENALARQFRDLAGRANQMIATACERVVFIAAGQALIMKGER